ncbi:TetR/AcrR family transcriptional regulator [Aquibium sp. LZ166]|uniref:TetR/AcrR family transcriptional regulator n=1 Tax=Aquibium pacificus TaxID=3153579 RepID=A0ABV3SBK5_9HYPH
MAGADEQKTSYHHGDLRHALLKAAEAELREKGVEGFTLRGCAKRAGVSHAAPAHHFRDANGLLTALAAIGFERFLSMQKARQAAAPAAPRAQLAASGLGYIDFALENPDLFRLVFTSSRTDFEDMQLGEAARASFDHLVAGIAELRGEDPHADPRAMSDVMAVWATTHGLADLLLSGRLKALLALPKEMREKALADIILRAVPEHPSGTV